MRTGAVRATRRVQVQANSAAEEDMNVDQLMKRSVRSCQQEDSLDWAAQTMWEADCGCLPVVDGDGRLLAVITDRDICMAAHFQGGPLYALKVKSAMSKGI